MTGKVPSKVVKYEALSKEDQCIYNYVKLKEFENNPPEKVTAKPCVENNATVLGSMTLSMVSNRIAKFRSSLNEERSKPQLPKISSETPFKESLPCTQATTESHGSKRLRLALEESGENAVSSVNPGVVHFNVGTIWESFLFTDGRFTKEFIKFPALPGYDAFATIKKDDCTTLVVRYKCDLKIYQNEFLNKIHECARGEALNFLEDNYKRQILVYEVPLKWPACNGIETTKLYDFLPGGGIFFLTY